MADFLRTGIENSQGDDAIKEETLKIIDTSKEILARLNNNEEAAAEYADIQYATIGALTNLRAETHNDLDAIRAELGEGGSIDVYNYAQGDITQDELGNIAREYSDLEQLSNDEAGSEILTEDDLGTLGGFLFSQIQKTNEAIINGGETELQEQLAWYAYAFGGETGEFSVSAGLAYQLASLNLDESQMQKNAGLIQEIQNSNADIYTRLFRLSQVLFNVTQENGAPEGLEEAHHLATREIIKKVVENDTGTIAVGFNTETGYYTTNTIDSDSSELEVGTYLCSLNRSGKLTRENILSPNGPFSAIELFVILERYKNGEFGDENVRGLFTGYLGNFDINMQNIISETINNSTESRTILDCIESGTIAGENSSTSASLGPVLEECELCNKIDLFTIEDIRGISDQCWNTLADFEPEFETGLKAKLEFADQTIHDIDSAIREEIIKVIGDPIPEGLESKIQETATAIFLFMEGYFENNRNGICNIDLKSLFLENESSPFVTFQTYLQENYNIEIPVFSLIDTSVESGFNFQIEQAEGNIQAATHSLHRLQSLPEDQRTELQNRQIQELTNSIFEFEEHLETLTQKRDNASWISAEFVSSMTQEDVSLLRGLFGYEENPERVLAFYNAIQEHTGEVTLQDIERNLSKYIYYITDYSLLREVFMDRNNAFSESLQRLRLSDINPSLRGNFGVLLAFPSTFTSSDIQQIPETYFMQSSDRRGPQALIGEMLKHGNVSVIDSILTRIYIANIGTPAAGMYIIENILSDYRYNEEEKETLKSMIPPTYWRSCIERGILPPEIIPDGEKLGELSNYIFTVSSGEKAEDISPIVQELENIILTNGVISQNLEVITALIEKGYITYAPNILFAICNTPNNDFENNNGEHSYKNLQLSLLERSPNFIGYFSASNKSQDFIIQKAFESCQGNVNTLKNIYPYFEVDSISYLENIFLSLSESFGAETAKTFLGTDKGIISLIESTIGEPNSRITEEQRGMIISILDYTSDLHQMNLRAQQSLEQQSQLGEKESIITEILDELGIDISTEDIGKILMIYNSPQLSPEDIGTLLEIIPQNQVENFIVRLAESMQEEALSELEQLYAALLDQGVEEINTSGFGDLFTDKGFNQEGFRNLFQEFINENQITTEDLENPSEEILMFFTFRNNNFSEAQKNIISQILRRELNLANNISPYTNVEIVRGDLEAYKERGIEGILIRQRERGDIRIESGNVFLTGSERDRTHIFNYETGVLENNPNYKPTERSKQDPETVPPANLQPSELGLDSRDTYREISTELMLTQEEQSSLTIEELDAISSNESVKENFIGFRSVLSELGITEMWKHRHSIFKAIGSLDINQNDGNYLSKEEMNKVISKMVYATTGHYKLQHTPPDLTATKNIIKDINKQQGGINDIDSVNAVGDALTGIEFSFVEQFADRNDGIIGFKFNEFQKALSRPPILQ